MTLLKQLILASTIRVLWFTACVTFLQHPPGSVQVYNTLKYSNSESSVRKSAFKDSDSISSNQVIIFFSKKMSILVKQSKNYIFRMHVWIFESTKNFFLRRQKFFISAHILHNTQFERILNLCAGSWKWIVNHRMSWAGIWKFASFHLTRTFPDAQDHPKINKKGLMMTSPMSLGWYFCLLLFHY